MQGIHDSARSHTARLPRKQMREEGKQGLSHSQEEEEMGGAVGLHNLPG